MVYVIILSDRPGAKYQPGPGPGDHFLAGAGVLFLAGAGAGAGDFWCFSPTITNIFARKTLGTCFFPKPNPMNATLVQKQNLNL